MTAPPPKPVKPGQVKVVRALYTYEAQSSDELSFEEGDLLYIFDMISSPDWWRARANGKEGLIPSNYVSQQTESIENPMHEAAKRGNLEFLLECLSNKVSVNGLDNAGCTPLHWAAFGGHYDCAKLLIDTKCQIDIKNKLGETPLHNASLKGHAVIVELLLKSGANASALNNDKETPYKLARNPECAALLRSADSNFKPNFENYVDDEDSD